MKAWILHGIDDIRFEEVNIPKVGKDEALIKIKACGICGSDIPRIYENGAHNMPLIPGHEFSGVVAEIGSNVNADWFDKRVGIFPMLPCEKCEPCLEGHTELCKSYDYLGSRSNGGYAEYVIVPVKNLIQLPENVGFEEAAMLEPMAVAVHAMRIGIGTGNLQLPKDSKVTVCGLGTIGMLLTLFLMDAGYKNLYVIGNKAFQREMVQKIGIYADNYIYSNSEDVHESFQKIGGADLFFECVGKNECLNLGIDVSAPMGRIVTVGNPYGDVFLTRDTYWEILRRQLSVLGTWNSSFTLGKKIVGNRTIGHSNEDKEFKEKTSLDDWEYALSHIENFPIRPAELITHKYTLSELRSGLELMRDKKEPYCKVMITMNSEGKK